MAKLNHRSNMAVIAATTGNTPAAAYTVTAYPIGAVVSSASADTTVPVRPGHSFKVNDKFIVGTDEDKYRTVTAVTQSTLTVGSAVSVSAGDLLTNLQADSGATTPAYDGSTIDSYSDPEGSGTNTSATVTCDSNGNYDYYHRGSNFWELIRDSDGAPAQIIDGIGGDSPNLNVVDYGAGIQQTDNENYFQAAVDAADGLNPTVDTGPDRANNNDQRGFRYGGIPIHFPTSPSATGWRVSDETLVDDNAVLIGDGPGTYIVSSSTTKAIFKCRTDPDRTLAGTDKAVRNFFIRNMTLSGGLYCIEMENTNQWSEIHNVQVTLATSHGIYIKDCFGVQILNVRSFDNGGAGLHVGGFLTSQNNSSNNTRIIGGQYTRNQGNGITLNNCANTTVDSIDVLQNEVYGIALHASDSTEIRAGVVENNINHGIYADNAGTSSYDCRGLYIRSMKFPANTVSGAGIRDVYLDNVSQYWMENLWFSSTDNDGIETTANTGYGWLWNETAGEEDAPSITDTSAKMMRVIGDSNARMYFQQSIRLANGKGIYVDDTGGTAREILSINGSNELELGQSSLRRIKTRCPLQLGDAAIAELTIASGAVTITNSAHTIDTESDAESDDLDTITGTTGTNDSTFLLIKPANDARTVVVKNGTGNILTQTGADVTMDTVNDNMLLIYDGTNWLEVSSKLY